MRAAELNEQEQKWVQSVPVKEFYTVQDVCVILNVGGASVYGAIKRGTVAGVRVGGVVHIRHAALEAYLQRRGAAPVFDPDNLVIEDIIPEREAAKSASNMLPEDADDFDDFLND